MNSVLEKRSADYRILGRMKTFLSVVFLLAVLGYGYHTSNAWQQWAFEETIDINEFKLSVKIDNEIIVETRTSNRHFKNINFDKSKNFDLNYIIDIPDLPTEAKQLSYIHLGWITGSNVRITYKNLLIEHKNFEKVSLNYQGAGVIKITVSCPPNSERCGLTGIQPAAIATGFKQNKGIFGLETLVTQFKAILYLLPTLSIGLLLACAWLMGFNGRVLFLSLSIILLLLTKNSIRLFSDSLFDPVVWRSYIVLSGLLTASWVFCFHLEVTKTLRKQIYSIQRFTLIAAATLFMFFPGEKFFNLFGHRVDIVSHLIYAIGSFTIYAVVVKRKEKNLKNLIFNPILFTGIVGVLLIVERSAFKSNFSHIVFELFLPIYIGYLALQDIASSEKRYQQTKKEKSIISDALSLETEKTASLQRFLPQTIVNQFQDGKTMQENIEKVLRPSVKNVAVIQADMRGFSQFLASEGPEKVSSTIKECFAPVVLLAQEFSYLKLVGDCFFAFIEDTEGERSATDFALEVAHMLVSQVQEVNKKSESTEIRFGIGIAYGSALVGNLSSDQCIDYSVVGESANLAARLEELSKNQDVETFIGKNAVILNDTAAANLRRYSSANIHNLSDIKVRSFENLQEVCYIEERQILNLANAKPLKKAG